MTHEQLPPEIAAVWGAFLFEGMMTSRQDPDRADHVLRMWNAGCIDLVTQACGYLNAVWKCSYERWHQAENFDGVFEYDVISHLGSLLGYSIMLNDGKLPPESISNSMIEDLVNGFFSLTKPAVKQA